MFAADNWCVKVNDKVYGPYTSQQLRKFAHEGRLAAWSLIAPAGSRAWRKAQDENTFASFFGVEPKRTAGSARSFGKRDEATEDFDACDAETAVETDTAKPRPSNKPKPRTAINAEQPEPANYVLIFDVVNAAASRAEAAILSLGPGFRIADNVWTISSTLTAIGVRNAVAPYLLPHESIFVVDATNGRTAWQNYAPETNAKLAAAYVNLKKRAQ